MISANQQHGAGLAGSSARLPLPAIALASACLATIALLAHHPVARRTPDDPHGLHELVHLGGQAALVHGALFAIFGALLYGVIGLAFTLDRRRPAVTFGLAMYGAGCGAMAAAMLLDGFVIARLAQRLLGDGQSPEGMAALALVAIGIQVFTRAGFFGMGIGMCALSWARAGAGRLLAALALPAAVLPLALLASSGMTLRPVTLIGLTALQATWYLGAAFRLWQRGAPLVPVLRR